ncbi:hypothetical protein AGMMS49579_04620 [Spirochaetia bacterium]|nr:hypothetical protein AGMMS49579_04620 [Spirochaetia bacterium]
MGVNSKYKDSLFSWLFSDPDTLRELYGAIEGVHLDPAIPITINTLEGILYMDRMNDISFEIAGKLVVLIEHQSTINPNMALRLLMYIARVYEKIIGSRNIYSGKKLLIPRSEFIVLYNGKAPYPDETTIKLSDSWNQSSPEDTASPGLIKNCPPDSSPGGSLELTAKVYNINKDHNNPIVRGCQRLSWYSAFIAKVRECEETAPDKETAMRMAINYCIKHDIMKEFFEANASEVVNMLLTEWNWDDAKEVWQEEAREEGEKIGEKIGENKVLELMEQGYTAEQIKAKLSTRTETAGK